MAAVAALPVPLPVQPADERVRLPHAPAYPPTVGNVLDALEYRNEVEVSIAMYDHHEQCTPEDHYNSVLYEHKIIAQAVAAAGEGGAQEPAAPPAWFQGAMQQLHGEIQQLRVDLQEDLQEIRHQLEELRESQYDIRDQIQELQESQNGIRGQLEDLI